MWDRYLQRQMQRGNRNLLLTGLLLIGAVAALAAAPQRYWYNFRHGPFAIRDVDLAKPGEAPPVKVWVTLESLYEPAAIGSQSSSKHGRVNKYFHYLPLEFVLHKVTAPGKGGAPPTTRPATNDELLQVKAYLAKHHKPPKGYVPMPSKGLLVGNKQQLSAPGKFTGELSRIPTDVRRDLELDKDFPELLPLMLDMNNYRVRGYTGIGFGSVLALAGLLTLLTAMRRMQDPTRHWTWQQLATYGDPDILAMTLEAELSTDGSRVAVGRTVVTSNWLLRSRAYGVEVMSLDAVVWAYEKVVQHYTNGIPTGKEFAAMVGDRHGRLMQLGAKKATTQETLAEIARRRPWSRPTSSRWPKSWPRWRSARRS
ncbi:MAG: hypothetical protein HYU66_06165 [Armatimonadetes bacterium]|nr:hypothetical protein [Armatimonadota bacterium]